MGGGGGGETEVGGGGGGTDVGGGGGGTDIGGGGGGTDVGGGGGGGAPTAAEIASLLDNSPDILWTPLSSSLIHESRSCSSSSFIMDSSSTIFMFGGEVPSSSSSSSSNFRSSHRPRLSLLPLCEDIVRLDMELLSVLFTSGFSSKLYPPVVVSSASSLNI